MAPTRPPNLLALDGKRVLVTGASKGIGRGLAAAFAGRPERVRPTLGAVAATLRRHAALLVEHHGDETRGCRDIRKHVAWYSKGLPGSAEFRAAVTRLDEVAAVRALVDAFFDPLIDRGAARSAEAVAA